MSNEKNTHGKFSIKTSSKNYLLVINCFQFVEGIVKVKASLHGKGDVQNTGLIVEELSQKSK